MSLVRTRYALSNAAKLTPIRVVAVLVTDRQQASAAER